MWRTRGRTFAAAAAAAAISAIASILLDRRSGRSRRAKLRDQTSGLLRRMRRRGRRVARHFAHEIEGKAHRVMRHNGGDPYPNDPTIKHRVESEILGRDPFNTAQINVGVEDGIVVLHGQVDDHTTRRALAFAVSRVDGVRGVRNNLHTADEPAPTAPGQS